MVNHVPSFNEYMLLEHYDVRDVKQQNKTYGEMHDGFKGLGYAYLGHLAWTDRKEYNNFCDKELEQAIEDNIWKLEEEVYGKPQTKCELDITLLGNNKNMEDVIDRVGQFEDTENICKIVYKKNWLYCFWNPRKKYYYFMSLQNRYTSRPTIFIGTTNMQKLFNRWIQMKHEGVEAVKDDMLNGTFDKQRAEEKKQKEEEKRRQWEEEKKKPMTKNDEELIAKADQLNRWHWREVDDLIDKADTYQAIQKLREIKYDLKDMAMESL